ncbi:1,4-beta-N-acetylmuramidase [Paenibacillus terrae]|uniref:Lysozyme n=1 Tax=Paenibacillus terrae TaxID=159743 RepID=A0A4U2PRU6_9BACL|nr:GH25 family lysozyme [Paenibacillus terrae]TKH42105.1 1,4-beta-N-acetylmuramidase [Paenibacillus terrae]
MKKIYFWAFLFLFLWVFPGETHATSSSSHIELDGKDLSTAKGIQIQEIKGSVLVPLRLIVEELGYKVNWDSKTSTVTIQDRDHNLSLQVNNPIASVDGIQMGLTVAPLLKGGTTYVPLRFVSEQTGLDVAWSSKLKTVFLTSPPVSSGSSAPLNQDSEATLESTSTEPVTSAIAPDTIVPEPVISSDGHAQGIDVSHYNGNIDWQQVAAAGKTFAFIKATEGTTYQDNQFLANVQGARDANILVGAYHFLNATTADGARQEAANFARAIESAGGSLDLPPVMDYENNPKGLTPAQISEVAHAFLDETEKLTGRLPIVYTGNVFASKFDPTLSVYKLWVARYSTTQKPTAVPAWDNWWAWQYSSTGSVQGIRGNVDLNEFNGTIDELRSSLAGDIE